MTQPFTLVVLGLSLSSSWGNGHATTFRALLRGLREDGHRILFLERDVPWYAEHRDLPDPDFCTLEFYTSLEDLRRYQPAMASADAVVVGSFVPEGVKIIDFVAAIAPKALCFYDIDTPVTLSRLDQGHEDYLSKRQIPLFDVYFSFSGGKVLDLLENRYGAKRAEALHCSVDPAQHFNTGEAIEWDLGYLGTYSSDRQPALERLLIEPARRLPDLRFVVAGAQFPDDIDWPANVERFEHLPPSRHASFYSRQRFTLNITRRDMIDLGWSPSVRLFEAAACGTAIISDRWRGLGELMPEDEAILMGDTTEEVVRHLTSLPETKRQAIAEAAHKRVLTAHTGRARAREMINAIEGTRPVLSHSIAVR
ncbi:glycosyltransferase [Phyllobacterium salinisoli]|uniref:Glycosyltransferase n=1 Tax=Phyllobacterium salinisoli TaxID=1899321 RepID=A0A368K916_9HYPH|nr:glycosyltransferase [Phyllobacterium salinisoli]RCS25105.1 glycosyltransferase [Phyllobacterium salinisoli]